MSVTTIFSMKAWLTWRWLRAVGTPASALYHNGDGAATLLSPAYGGGLRRAAGGMRGGIGCSLAKHSAKNSATFRQTAAAARRNSGGGVGA